MPKIDVTLDIWLSKLNKHNKALSVLFKIDKLWPEIIPPPLKPEVIQPHSIRASTLPHIKNYTNTNQNKSKFGSYTLIVSTINSAFSGQFYYLKKEILGKICNYFGYNIIDDIKIIVHPQSTTNAKPSDDPTTHPDQRAISKKAAALLEQIEDHNLKESLSELAYTLESQLPPQNFEIEQISNK